MVHEIRENSIYWLDDNVKEIYKKIESKGKRREH